MCQVGFARLPRWVADNDHGDPSQGLGNGHNMCGRHSHTLSKELRNIDIVGHYTVFARLLDQILPRLLLYQHRLPR